MYVLRPDHFGQPEERGFSVTAFGGPSQVNVVLESLQIAASGLTEASIIAEEQQDAQIGIGAELFDSFAGVALHWRIPVLGAQLGIDTAQAAMGSWAMEKTATAVERAHESYRDTEALLMRWFGAGRQLSQYPEIYPHLMNPQGDKALADAWARTALVNLGHGATVLFALFARKQPTLRASGEAAGLVGQAVMEKARRISSASTQSLSPQTHRLEARSTDQLADYLDAHAEVAELGDFSISSGPGPGPGSGQEEGQRARQHVIHIPGLELPEGLAEMDREDIASGELDLGSGRGVNSLLDAVANDSAHLQGVIDDALVESGAQPGDELVISGYSLGGLHALNIAAGGALARKYKISDVVTVASPGRSGPTQPGVRTTSFSDVNDPVPRLMSDQSQLSADRVEISYEYQNPDGEPGSIFGQSHSYEHNTEAIRKLEETASTHLDEGQLEHLRQLTASLNREHQATVYSTHWDSPGIEELEELIAELARLEVQPETETQSLTQSGIKAEHAPQAGEVRSSPLGVQRPQDEAVQQR